MASDFGLVERLRRGHKRLSLCRPAARQFFCHRFPESVLQTKISVGYSALVSILISAYNSARWLRDSVSSALAPTWARKEVIIVDDGSKDHTHALARTFESPIVKVVAQQNMGAPGRQGGAFAET